MSFCAKPYLLKTYVQPHLTRFPTRCSAFTTQAHHRISLTNGIVIFLLRSSTNNLHSFIPLPTNFSGTILSRTATLLPAPSPSRNERPGLRPSPEYIERLGTGPGLRATAHTFHWACWPAHPNGQIGCRGKAHGGTISFPVERVEVRGYVCLRSGGANPQASFRGQPV